MLKQRKQADRLIIPIGPIQNSDRRRGMPKRNWHSIQLHANEMNRLESAEMALGETKVRSGHLCLFHVLSPILGFTSKRRTTQPPQSGRPSSREVSAPGMLRPITHFS
jgi:hypothetical protein